eukprot:m.1042609 g.1042609  ORF g.1042609 m.1042609 type:complete len:415 (-) comp24162_c1_seq51:1811-3055(-)
MADVDYAVTVSTQQSPALKYFVTCSCECGDRMVLTRYEHGVHNKKGYENGWQCDRDSCQYDSRVNPTSDMSQTRFHCQRDGCNLDLCILCGRKKIPVFERNVGKGERTFKASFELQSLKASALNCDSTFTGAGTVYHFEIRNNVSGSTWTVSKRYSEFEALQQENAVFSKMIELPKKEVFPNVKKRLDRLGACVVAMCRALSPAAAKETVDVKHPEVSEELQARLVAFLCTHYVPVSTDPRLHTDDIVVPRDGDAVEEVVEAPVVQMMDSRPRTVPCPDCATPLSHEAFMAGPHNVGGYSSGWSCDSCDYLSTSSPLSQRSRFRYHCRACAVDYCIPCWNTASVPLTAVGDGTYSVASGDLSDHGGGGSSTPAVQRLRDAKALLDEGLIHQDDYDDLKRNVLTNLMGSGTSIAP